MNGKPVRNTRASRPRSPLRLPAFALPSCPLFGTHTTMKHLTATIALLALTLTARAALPQPDLLLHVYFAGAQKISADPRSNAFTNEFCSAEALALRTQTVAKL